MKQKNSNRHVNKMFFQIAFGLMMVEISNAVSFMIDTIIAARLLDETTVAAAGIISPVFSILALISGILTAGFQNISSRQIGEGHIDDAKDTWKVTWRFALIISGIVTLVGVLFSDDIASLLGAPVSTMKLHTDSAALVKGYMLGAVPFVFTSLFIPAIQINGKTNRVIISIVATIVVDTIGDLLNATVIGGGAFGMGLATSFSYLASALVLMAGLFDKKMIMQLSLKPSAPGRIGKTLKILTRGLPKATRRLGNVLKPVFINRLVVVVGGSVAMVALSVEGSVKNVIESPGAGISSAALMLVGIFIGEMDFRSLKEMQKTSGYLILVGVTLLGVVYFFLSGTLASLYVSPDSPSYQLTVNILRCHAVSLPFMAYNEYRLACFQAVGKIMMTHFLTALHRLVCIVGLSYLLCLFFGIDGIWYAIPLSEILVAVIISIIYKVANPLKGLMKPGFIAELFESLSSENEVKDFLNHVDAFLKEHNIEKQQSYYVYLFCEEISDLILKKGFEDHKEHQLIIRIIYSTDGLTIRTQDDCLLLSDIERSDHSTGAPDDPLLGLHMVFQLAKSMDYVNTLNLNHLIIQL